MKQEAEEGKTTDIESIESASTSESIDSAAIQAQAQSTTDPEAPPDAYGPLRFRDFRLLLSGSFLTMFGQQMITVAIGWELYLRTQSPLVLGGVGLAQVIPLIILFLPAGYVADSVSRKKIVFCCQVVVVLATSGLAYLSLEQGPLILIYGCLMAIGGAQSFNNPANSALVSQVIPEQAYEKAMTWRSSISQLSAVLGPAASGFLIGIFHGATVVYVLSGGCFLSFVVLLLFMRVGPQKGQAGNARKLSALVGGLRFLGQTQVMLAAITLDLFAVLLGGSTALLPVFATNILHVGPIGLGWLQAADSLGAVGMALLLAQRPPFKHAGRTLLIAVAGFGLATVVFGWSHWFWLSFIMLILLGAFDNVSVVIRSTLVLIRTPDEMRGRVSAVSSLFIGTSNQLGGFESGLAAQFLGPVQAVIAGGLGTVLVVLLIAGLWPDMRRLTTLRVATEE